MQVLTTNNRKSSAAIAYSTMLKWAVFPCHSVHYGQCTCGKDCSKPGKHPRTLHGFKDATNDPKQVKRWWEMWPDANIGLPTGATNGFFVVDVDPRHNGFETLEELQDTNNELPHTVTAISGSGGNHFLFKYPALHIKSGTNVLGPGIDIRGDGGYIVGAPSVHHSGRAYEWEVNSQPMETAISEAPEWLLRLAGVLPKHQAGAIGRIPSIEWEKLMLGFDEGGRNAAAARLIGHLLRKYVNPQLTYEIAKLWDQRNRPPLGTELDNVFVSILQIEARRRGSKRW